MRILADENLWPRAVQALRELGHDVEWVREDAPGTPDEDVLARATAAGRLLVTSGKDFGDLVFGARLPADYGVLLIRARRSNAARTAALVDAIQSRDNWRGIFAVAENERVRATQIPH